MVLLLIMFFFFALYKQQGIIDYIFYSRTRLRCLGVLGGIDQDWFKQNNVVGCPHPHVPSDHISLVTEFQLLPDDSSQSSSNGVNGASFTASRNGANSSPLSYQGPIWAGSAPHTRFTSVINGAHPTGNHLPSASPSAGRPGSANMHSPTNNANGAGLISSASHLGGGLVSNGVTKNGRR